MGHNTTVPSYVIKGLEISELTGKQFFELPNMFTQGEMPVTTNNIITEEELSKWSYLKDVRIPRISAGVDLLIGTNSSRLMEPWEVINSEGEGPYAVRTLLGWVINGPLRGNSAEQCEHGYPAVTVNRIGVDKLEELLIRQYNHDFNEDFFNDKEEMSREEKKFMEKVESSVQLKGGHYMMKLPFRTPHVNMPNNFTVAKQRVSGLKRRLLKDETFHKEYTDFLTDVINKGYAERVPESQLDRSEGKVWYLPHHGVYHPQKGNLRIVFDCGADFKGVSLNKTLLQGPNLTSSLLGVLTRFRQERVSIMADIQSMFHQVKVDDEHIDFLRFLWWPEGNLEKELVQYRMTVNLFGAVSSPSCACYALRKTAKDNQNSFSAEVIDTVTRNFYVDDLLKSSPSKEDAMLMVRNLTAICRLGGFNLTKWSSNNREVLLQIPEGHKSKHFKELDLDRDKLPVERALGLLWCSESDTLKFKFNIREQPHTRRGMLSLISSVYDPLGFLAPFTIPAKINLQDLCRLKYGWDDPIPQSFQQRWNKWWKDLVNIGGFKIGSCYKPEGFGQITSAQLHNFSDASETAYGTVTYLRLKNDKNKVHTTFVLGKARVSPLKQVTIPRLELTAAVLAVKVDKMIRSELQLPLGKSQFWTDSTSVLKYIKNDTHTLDTDLDDDPEVKRNFTVNAVVTEDVSSATHKLIT